jgi:alkanesulfonate monooxygenase SsuD/methylene tetrahydromethanopterin reductase-like flavin-dependent oxidoreductase (luciferase family)
MGPCCCGALGIHPLKSDHRPSTDVELSSFSLLDTYPGQGGGRRQPFQEFLDLVQVSERCGLAGIWVAEHHFQSGGVCPSPPVLLAAAAQRTHRLRLGSMVGVLPLHDPVHFAEEYSLVDQLSGGRLRLGVGSGYVPREFAGFGIDAGRKREIFDASLSVVLAAMSGKFVRGPRATSQRVRINVRPVQRPHPPVWIAAQRAEAVPFVAARGFSVALVPYASAPDLPGLARVVRAFRRASPPGSNAQVGVAVHFGAGIDPRRGRTALQRYLDSRMTARGSFLRDATPVPPHPVSAERLEEQGFALFGSRGAIEAGLEPFRRMGVDEILGHFDFGGLRTIEVHGSVQKLAEVMGSARIALESAPRGPELGAVSSA